MNRLALAIVSAWLTVACVASGTAPIEIESTFTADERETIERVAAEWFRAIPEAETSVSTGGEYPSVTRETGPAPPLANGDLGLAASTRTRLKVWADAAGPLFERVMRHELGHYLGAYEHPTNGQALKEADPSAWTCISAADIEAVCEGRGGCSEQTFPDCGEDRTL